MKKQYRQGDVLIEKVSSRKKPAKTSKSGRVILAHGEVTGHAHTIERGAVLSEYRTETAQGAPIQVADLDVTAAMAALDHQEHGTIEIDTGEHRVIRQREYSPEEIRNVAD